MTREYRSLLIGLALVAATFIVPLAVIHGAAVLAFLSQYGTFVAAAALGFALPAGLTVLCATGADRRLGDAMEAAAEKASEALAGVPARVAEATRSRRYAHEATAADFARLDIAALTDSELRAAYSHLLQLPISGSVWETLCRIDDEIICRAAPVLGDADVIGYPAVTDADLMSAVLVIDAPALCPTLTVDVPADASRTSRAVPLTMIAPTADDADDADLARMDDDGFGCAITAVPASKAIAAPTIASETPRRRKGRRAEVVAQTAACEPVSRRKGRAALPKLAAGESFVVRGEMGIAEYSVGRRSVTVSVPAYVPADPSEAAAAGKCLYVRRTDGGIVPAFAYGRE
jgi:hypothetical protein